MTIPSIENDRDMSTASSAYQNQNTKELFRSNLFRYECDELLAESHLLVVPNESSHSQLQSQGPKMMKYSSLIQNYVSNVQQILLSSFSESSSSSSNKKQKQKDKSQYSLPIPDVFHREVEEEEGSGNCPTFFRLKSDKYRKLGKDWKIPLPRMTDTKSSLDNNDTTSKTKGNCTIDIHPVGSYKHQFMTSKEANGYVLPMVDLAMIIGNPKSEYSSGDDMDMANPPFWMPKDYLNYRYLDVSTLMEWN